MEIIIKKNKIQWKLTMQCTPSTKGACFSWSCMITPVRVPLNTNAPSTYIQKNQKSNTDFNMQGHLEIAQHAQRTL
jgi:hypothetical protein